MEAIHKKAMDLVRRFADDFVVQPYRCYTEHGLHALFFAELFTLLAPEERYFSVRGRAVGCIQKEYPTATKLGRSKRQHWDIAVLDSSVGAYMSESKLEEIPLVAVFEFGLNEAVDHLKNDLDRLLHSEARVENAVAVHLQRIGDRVNRFSDRDFSPSSARIVDLDRVVEISAQYEQATIIFANTDSTRGTKDGAWEVRGGNVQ